MGIASELAGHAKDLGGGFTVRRLLPAARQRSVGPFLFFDHFGPVSEVPGVNHDVRPHPAWARPRSGCWLAARSAKSRRWRLRHPLCIST